MDLQIHPLPYASGAIPGLSERLISSHHQNNYAGAVKRLNAIRERLADSDWSGTPGFVLNGLKREELIATNSMLLHELYFASLGGKEQPPAPAMELAFTASFGSPQRWRDEFTACAKALAGGSGWMLLVFLPREGCLVNQWASDHTQAVTGGVPLLALDMYEHAYHMDFGAAAGAYVDACMAAIDWAALYARYQAAVHAASEPYGAEPADLAGSTLLDVRRAGVFEQTETMLPEARWRDPGAVTQWIAELSRGQAVTVYCAYGHEVSRAVALRLRAAGLNARFLRGGIDAWTTAGRPVTQKVA